MPVAAVSRPPPPRASVPAVSGAKWAANWPISPCPTHKSADKPQSALVNTNLAGIVHPVHELGPDKSLKTETYTRAAGHLAPSWQEGLKQTDRCSQKHPQVLDPQGRKEGAVSAPPVAEALETPAHIHKQPYPEVSAPPVAETIETFYLFGFRAAKGGFQPLQSLRRLRRIGGGGASGVEQVSAPPVAETIETSTSRAGQLRSVSALQSLRLCRQEKGPKARSIPAWGAAPGKRGKP